MRPVGRANYEQQIVPVNLCSCQASSLQNQGGFEDAREVGFPRFPHCHPEW